MIPEGIGSRPFGQRAESLAATAHTYDYAARLIQGPAYESDGGLHVAAYPCGVACCAGDLMEMESDLNGVNWTTTAQYLKADSIVRRNNEFHQWDIRGTAQVITDGIGAIIANDTFDSFGVKRFSSGNAGTPWRLDDERIGSEGLSHGSEGDYLAGRNLAVSATAGVMEALWIGPVCRLIRIGGRLILRCFRRLRRRPKSQPKPQPKDRPGSRPCTLAERRPCHKWCREQGYMGCGTCQVNPQLWTCRMRLAWRESVGSSV